MEDELMEQIRTRLAAATSAATALAKSLDALDENSLQTLELWLAKQEGDSRCGKCSAQMPRGKEASVCIACGSTRPPLLNTPAYGFKVSFAFLQFLETIHPPLKSGSRKIWKPIVSTASGSLEPSASIAVLPVESDVAVTMIAGMPVEPEVAETSIENIRVEREATVALELLQQAKEILTIDKNIYPDNFQESSSDSMNGMKAGEDGREADDFGDFQESWGENAIEPGHEISEDVVKLNGYSHADQFRTDLEAAKVEKEPAAVYAAATNSGSVNTWDTDWDYAPSHFMSAKTQSEDHVPSDSMVENSVHITSAAPPVPEYDLSIFESFGGLERKEEKVLPDTDVDATFWGFQNKNIVNSRLASIKAMERFASDTSAFTTITDADSDFGESSPEALPPPKLPVDILMGLGAISGQNNLLGSLASHELDDFQKVPASSHPLATLPTPQAPFSWPLDTLDAVSNQVVGGDVQNVESSSVTTLETSEQVAVDPFLWSHEEFDTGASIVAQTKIQQGSLDLMDPGPAQSEGNRVDPFSWPLDTFNQSMPVADKDDAIGPVSAQVIDAGEEESEDWGDKEFVWSQAEPANDAFSSNVDVLPSSPSSTSFSSNTVSGDNFMDKDRFFHDQSSPIPGVTKFSAGSPDGLVNLGNGLDSLVTMEEQKTVVEDDLFKSAHVKSLSFGDYYKKADNIDDLFKRSVSFGNLQVKDMTEGDELQKTLQTSAKSPSFSRPTEDILNFLNLKSPAVPQVGESFTKLSHVRSVSFDTVELVPEEQSDEMFQFFHTRSQSAGSSANKISAVEDIATSSSGKNIFGKVLSMAKTQNPGVDDDPFGFIHTAISPSEALEVKATTNGDHDDDGDDFFEWKSAEMPAATSPSVDVVLQPSVPTPASSQSDLFQWGSPRAASPSKPSITGSLSGLLSLAGGLPPSQIRTSSKEDDLFAALSRNSYNSGGVQTRQATVQVNSRLQPAATDVHSSNPGDDSEDEFSDFVSTAALPSASPPTSTQPTAGQTSQPAFDVSFFEAAQPNPSEKRNLDFFGDLMGLNFTNA